MYNVYNSARRWGPVARSDRRPFTAARAWFARCVTSEARCQAMSAAPGNCCDGSLSRNGFGPSAVFRSLNQALAAAFFVTTDDRNTCFSSIWSEIGIDKISLSMLKHSIDAISRSPSQAFTVALLATKDDRNTCFGSIWSGMGLDGISQRMRLHSTTVLFWRWPSSTTGLANVDALLWNESELHFDVARPGSNHFRNLVIRENSRPARTTNLELFNL